MFKVLKGQTFCKMANGALESCSSIAFAYWRCKL